MKSEANQIEICFSMVLFSNKTRQQRYGVQQKHEQTHKQ